MILSLEISGEMEESPSLRVLKNHQVRMIFRYPHFVFEFIS